MTVPVNHNTKPRKPGYRFSFSPWVPADVCDRIVAEATQHGPDVRKIKRAAQEGDG